MEVETRADIPAAVVAIFLLVLCADASGGATYTFTQHLPSMHTGDQPTCVFSLTLPSYLTPAQAGVYIPWPTGSVGVPNQNASNDGYKCSQSPEVQLLYPAGEPICAGVDPCAVWIFQLTAYSTSASQYISTVAVGSSPPYCNSADPTNGCTAAIPAVYRNGSSAGSGGGMAWAPDTLTVTGSVAPCTKVSIDSSFSFGLINVSFAPSSPGSCVGVVSISNNKNYWTNYQLKPTGNANYSPLGGNTNFYTNNHLLPPSGLVGSGTAIQYNVSFSTPGDGLSVFVDPTGQQIVGGNAKLFNMVQIILNAIPVPGVSAIVTAAQFVSTDYEIVIQSFAQMPSLTAADQALFYNFNLLSAISDLGAFFSSPAETAIFGSMVQQILLSDGRTISLSAFVSDLVSTFGAAVKVIYAASLAVGNVFALDFQYSQGSVQLNAQ